MLINRTNVILLEPAGYSLVCLGAYSVKQVYQISQASVNYSDSMP